jgi:hypothetical protein
MTPSPDRWVRGSERGGLGDGRPDHGNAEDVGLVLHQRHAATDLERGELDAGVGVQRIDDLFGPTGA